jgi:hypothetical protein
MITWKDIIEMGLKQTDSEAVDWIHKDRDQPMALVNTVKKIRFP